MGAKSYILSSFSFLFSLPGFRVVIRVRAFSWAHGREGKQGCCVEDLQSLANKATWVSGISERRPKVSVPAAALPESSALPKQKSNAMFLPSYSVLAQSLQNIV